ncbi:hypothetical protein BZG36_03149 [Bifiguratus adelaidae]|uniref:Protein YOP1 n=1 Tax=Bifiguratus adelaidae TaxID=1938954 RepID=A0A261XX78_9FUNG|nr:hypothetical protein BZG36_03149 [Bifiguratus adelaidae]
MSGPPPASANNVPPTFQPLVNQMSFYNQTLDNHLSNHAFFNEFERRTGIPKTSLFMTVFFLVVIMVFSNFAAGLVTNLIGWVYPAIKSFQAIESPQKDDDTQWLTYWTVFGFLSTLEYFSDRLVSFFPFYYTAKLAFILWLFLPQFQGAQVLYQRILRPQLLMAKPGIDAAENSMKAQFNKFTQ